MQIRFVGIDPETGQGNSPTVWVDEGNGGLLVQSYTADEESIAGVLAAGHGPDHDNTIPAHEAVIRIPARMVPILRKACDDAERSELR
ncbi:hypothetical protein KV557_09430 [Kitasatospora aureofaciens]|uniref:hypothetical protein n=1 Tax=Kitasatospora aureofaciens TaxID=1894 RepID=UPI001C45D8EA|nr:hypothetical protein [Kitasatospora aureofaciens]MBV6697344.1 hypothetical protein [Kitasatospora aureofaciens]